jgi:hypothetical protein
VEELPPVTDAGLTDTDARTGGLMVNAADCVPFNVALIFAVVIEATAAVFTVNVVVVAFAATVTLEPTDADPLSLESTTFAPPAGAGPLNVTVPVEAAPPATVAGFRTTEATAGGLIVKDADCVALYVPLTVAVVCEPTAIVLIVKLAAVLPAATTMLTGTVADPLSLERATVAPPAGAGPFSVTVPAELLPPRTLVGLSATEARAGGLIVSEAVCVPL